MFLSTICTFGGISYIYVGFLQDILWDDRGDPEHFGLSDVLRRKLSEDETPKKPGDGSEEAGSKEALPHKEPTDRWYPVKADMFWLDKSEMNTINIRVFVLDSEVKVEEPDSPEEHSGETRPTA